jgi:predicted RNase H-like HicB family nuclease
VRCPYTFSTGSLSSSGGQIAIDCVEQANAVERFDAAKRDVVDVDDPNTTVAVNELLHGWTSRVGVCQVWWGCSRNQTKKEKFMLTPNYNAVIRQDGDWWIGWIEEVPGVNSQGTTRDELLANLREALGEAIEMNREDARKAAGESFEEVVIQP